MTMNLSKSLVETTEASSPDVPPHDPRPLDWGQAVDAAAARLEESWVKPDATGHMLALGLADELAATLCAYGMVAAEVDHMHHKEEEVLASGQPTEA
jgi:hypothetical protein